MLTLEKPCTIITSVTASPIVAGINGGKDGGTYGFLPIATPSRFDIWCDSDPGYTPPEPELESNDQLIADIQTWLENTEDELEPPIED
jgi:hypothetical protein